MAKTSKMVSLRHESDTNGPKIFSSPAAKRRCLARRVIVSCATPVTVSYLRSTAGACHLVEPPRAPWADAPRRLDKPNTRHVLDIRPHTPLLEGESYTVAVLGDGTPSVQLEVEDVQVGKPAAPKSSAKDEKPILLWDDAGVPRHLWLP